MKRRIPPICIFGFLLTATSIASAQSHGNMPQTANDSQLQSYLEQVSELSSRARANVYFPNVQPIFNGVQVGFVNVGEGNLTFQRRDIVTSGRIPLVLARVYDSANTGTKDFGPGWTLSAAETIALDDHVAQLFSESGSVIEFVERNPSTFLLKQGRPSDYLRIERPNRDIFRAYLRSGILKEYKRIGDLYRLVTVTDRNGNQLHLAYSNGALSKLDNGNHSIAFTRNERGRILAAQDDKGRMVQYVYDEKGLLIEVDDLGGNAWRYRYDDRGTLKRATDPLQRENFSVEYDASKKVRRLQLPSGVIQYTYNAANRSTTVKDRKELISRYFQNDDGITTRVVNALGEETSIVLDANRNVTSLSRNGTVVEAMEYDQQYRLKARHHITNSGTNDYTYSYDPQTGLLSRIDSSDGSSRIFTHNPSGNLTSASLLDGPHIYKYSSSGDLSAFTAGKTNVGFAADSDGLIASMTEGQNATTTMAYQAGGQLSQITFSDGRSATFNYQPSGLRAKLAYKDGRQIEYNYDPAGNLTGTKVFDPSSRQIAGQTLVMNNSYQLVRWTLFDGTETTFQYDPNGNLTEWKQEKSVTRFEYDQLNRLVTVITPDGQRLTYTYEPGERSLIDQYEHAGGLLADLRDTGFTFASQSQVTATHPIISAFGSVRFAENLGTFQLANADGTEIITPDAGVEQPLQKLRLVTIDGAPLRARQAEFNRPFNTMFMPAEYASINCCPLCTLSGCPPGCDNGGPAPGPPNHVSVVIDNIGFPNACPSTGVLVRQMLMQVVDSAGNAVANDASIVESFSNMSTNTCGNGSPNPSSCAPTGNCTSCDVGQFLDTLTVSGNLCNSGISQSSGCGFSLTSTWSLCAGGTATLWNSPRIIKSNSISVNGSTSSYSAGTQFH